MKRIISVIVFAGLVFASPALAQEDEHHHHPPSDTTAEEQEAVPHHDDGGRHIHEDMAASSAVVPTAPMQRDASGTSWIPDASPMHAAHAQRSGWDLMVHGTAFVRYTVQDVFESGTRGDRQLDVPNWLMGMARRDISPRGQVAFRGMMSLDPLTIGGSGYPLLFQTGETFEGEPLVDRQHPHDLFAELAVMSGYRIGEHAAVFGYFGLPGEPALGPPAFMHRPSAQHNPDAPLGHHWQDATHIVYGVATLGFNVGPVKVDGSVFTGREPDEERFGFDRPRFDSYSARVSVNPTDRLALQISSGFLKEPEHHEPEVDQRRTTASAIYARPLGHLDNWSSTLAWGYNEGRSEHDDDVHTHGSTHSFLAETDLVTGPQALYNRVEWVQKSPAELALELDQNRLAIGALTLGAARDLALVGGLQFTLGVQGTIYSVPAEIQSAYGERPVSAQAYLRIAPVLMGHQGC